jgi:hypothetical protein
MPHSPRCPVCRQANPSRRIRRGYHSRFAPPRVAGRRVHPAGTPPDLCRSLAIPRPGDPAAALTHKRQVPARCRAELTFEPVLEWPVSVPEARPNPFGKQVCSMLIFVAVQVRQGDGSRHVRNVGAGPHSRRTRTESRWFLPCPFGPEPSCATLHRNAPKEQLMAGRHACLDR